MFAMRFSLVCSRPAEIMRRTKRTKRCKSSLDNFGNSIAGFLLDAKQLFRAGW
jgi:hypothetical protein